MRIRHTIMSVALLLAAGCDTMEQDGDGIANGVNSEPAYLLSNTTAIIDLQSRIVAPGKITVDILTSAQNGRLADLGKGIIQYTPAKGSKNDSFEFSVHSEDGTLINRRNSIEIILVNDSTDLPCKYVYARSDSAKGVIAPVTVDVAANDYSCSTPLSISISVGPEHGTASIVGNKIKYIPGASYLGRDQILYKATSSDPSVIPGYAMLWINSSDSVDTNPGPDSTWCRLVAVNDSFLMASNLSMKVLDVLANDSICNSNLKTFTIQNQPHFGTAFINSNKKIEYTRDPMMTADTLSYLLCDSLQNCSAARVIIKRQ